MLLIAIGFISYAQKISDAYFNEREKYWTTTYKAYIDKNRKQQDSLLNAYQDNFIKNGGRNDRGAHLPNLFLNVEPLKKERKKENEKGSLENYLAGDYRCTYCRRHHARRYRSRP